VVPEIYLNELIDRVLIHNFDQIEIYQDNMVSNEIKDRSFWKEAKVTLDTKYNLKFTSFKDTDLLLINGLYQRGIKTLVKKAKKEKEKVKVIEIHHGMLQYPVFSTGFLRQYWKVMSNLFKSNLFSNQHGACISICVLNF